MGKLKTGRRRCTTSKTKYLRITLPHAEQLLKTCKLSIKGALNLRILVQQLQKEKEDNKK